MPKQPVAGKGKGVELGGRIGQKIRPTRNIGIEFERLARGLLPIIFRGLREAALGGILA